MEKIWYPWRFLKRNLVGAEVHPVLTVEQLQLEMSVTAETVQDMSTQMLCTMESTNIEGGYRFQ